MINKENYFLTVDNFGVDALSPTLLKSHQHVLRVTNEGESWERYDTSDAIKNFIDVYFQKLDDFIKRAKPIFQIPAKKAARQESNSTKKDKSKKIKEPQAEDDLAEPKSVARISEEVKFIKRFVGLHNKKKSPQTILSFIKSLQRSIVQKLIRKTSPLAKEIESIQQAVIDFYHSMKGEKAMNIREEDLPKLVAIAGGEKVYPSLNIMKRYIGLQGKPIDKNLIDRFIIQIEKVLDKKLLADDPYADKVKDIYNTLRKSKNSKTFSIKSSELNGLTGIVKEYQCKHKHLGQIYRIKKKDAAKAVKAKRVRECNYKTYSDSKGKGTCSHTGGLRGVDTDNPILTAEQMANRKHELIQFHSYWRHLFGVIEKNFILMVHGEPGNGKTILLLSFAKYLADYFGNVLYVSSEECTSYTMTKKINELVNPIPSRLEFVGSLKGVDLSEFDFVFLDSVNDLQLKSSDVRELHLKHPHLGFILNLQHTKGGNFRGDKGWEHLPGIVGEVYKGILTLTKNRYGDTSIFNFFEQFGLQWRDRVVVPIERHSESPSIPSHTDDRLPGNEHII